MTKKKNSEGVRPAELDLGSLNGMLGVELRNAQSAAESAFARLSGKTILAGHYTILMLIRNNPGQNQTTLAKTVKLDRSTMVPILDQFERLGWVQRQPFAGDRRAYALHLTKTGEKKLKELDVKVKKMESHITKKLGKSDKEQLVKLLKTLQDIL